MTKGRAGSMRGDFQTPVLLIGYNRPDCMQRVAAALSVVRPPAVWLAVDGPKAGKPGDSMRCDDVVRVVNEAISWPCELRLLRREHNLGCARSVSEAVTWFLNDVPAGIILEDDTVPAPDFFSFCAELLDRYRDDDRVWSVVGSSFHDARKSGGDSYYFSKYSEAWGWATWRRAWCHFKWDFPDLDEVEQAAWWLAINSGPFEAAYWRRQFDAVASGVVDSWDYRWMFCCMQRGGLTAVPHVNLITNIGFGVEATHTIDPQDPAANRPTDSLGALQHPAEVKRDFEAEAWKFSKYCCRPGGDEDRRTWEFLLQRLQCRLRTAEEQAGAAKQRATRVKTALHAAIKERDALARNLSWAAEHRWRAARKLLTGRWPRKKTQGGEGDSSSQPAG